MLQARRGEKVPRGVDRGLMRTEGAVQSPNIGDPNGILHSVDCSAEGLDRETVEKMVLKGVVFFRGLQSKDLSLCHSMIPLGSCTMKLNATVEMMPVTWPSFANIHPFAPTEQAKGYQEMFENLGDLLCTITGFDSFSLQPNAGAAGEYAGLMVIRAYHMARGDHHRNVCIIPQSAHGTNPASAAMCGMKIVTIGTDAKGNIDIPALKEAAEKHKENLSALMV